MICYGLAEATLLVAATKPGQKIDTAKNLSRIKAGLTIYPESCEYIDCGFPAHGCEVSILNSETGQLAEENQIGEILIAGPNVASGYLLNEKRIDLEQKEISDITWCATGDLGFINLGRLFITGRKKNLIKIYGQNLHAEDIERKVSSLLPLINNNAVFPHIDGSKESIVLTLELPDANYKSELTKINLVNLSREIGIFFGITPFDILIVPKWGIPRTTSGKIQREKLQQLYANSRIKYLDKLRQ
jgi:nonribosomal peptide synthetase protein BlmVI